MPPNLKEDTLLMISDFITTIPGVILGLAVGLVLILIGANYLVDGSSSIAKKFGLSEFVIGLTIVGIGTSTPEMVVSFMSAIQGKAEMAIGNVVGSNIINTLLILGITALISPLVITKDNLKKDIPLNIGVTVLLVLMGLKNTLFGIGADELSRWDGAIFLLIFVIYMWRSFRSKTGGTDTEDDSIEIFPNWMSVIFIISGLIGLILGGKVFVNNAVRLAETFRVSEKFIAITIMALGTSLPELATCIVAAAKGRGQLALGNIIGSNISNIILILGGASLIRPLSYSGITSVDSIMLIICSLAIFITAYTFTRNKIDRVEGAIFLGIEIAYLWFLLTQL